MLTADLVRPRIHRKGSELVIDLLDTQNPFWLQTASELLALMRTYLGQPLSAWEQALEIYEGERIEYVVLRGLAKVLSDAATFTPLTTPLPPAQIREQLFRRGPVFSTPHLFHPQVRSDLLQNLASELFLSSDQLEQALFADRPSTYLLTDLGPDWQPEALLARYNLELARGVLYWATHMRIEIHDTYKDIFKYLKLFKLMFWIHIDEEDGYTIDLDGPISPFVSSTTRYGRQFAAFLPALFLCQRWNMSAMVRAPQNGTLTRYRLDSSSPLQTHFKGSGPFDSRLEANFAAEFAEKFGDKRGLWQLSREDELLPLVDTVMIPDFALTHKRTGQRILIELVGFWHPDYLRRKVAKVRAAQCRNLLLLVYEGINLSPESLRDVPGEVLYFKQKPVLKEVMSAVERMAANLN